MNSLKEQIISANNAYRSGDPIMSDQSYDDLLDLLEEEMNFIEFESFKQTLTESKGTIKLDYVLGSLTKIKYEESDNLYKWIKKNNIKSIFASLKVDGCSFNASWRNGVLVMCSSRGDGETGTDWTEKAKYILPCVIDFKQDLDIRGEFTLTNDSHVTLGYKSRRVGTVGIMNEDRIVPEKLKHVKAISYEVLSGTMCIEEQFSFLKEFGFTTPLVMTSTLSKELHEDLKKVYLTAKSAINYDIDGIVISAPTYTREDVFFPETKVAFKINADGVDIEVLGIEWSISKGGRLVPVVLLTPTEIEGSTISRVTGINAQYILDNEIMIGTIVTVIKSGCVIPKIIGVRN